MVFKKFRLFHFWHFFIFTGGSNEVAGPPRQHLECLKGSHSEWRRSHSSAGQWERRTLSKQKGQNWNLHSVPVTRWPIASSSCKPLAARLINNTPRVVALSRNEAWREVEAVRRHVECCLSVGCQYSNKKIIEINIEESKIHRDNGPILTLASSARWSAPSVHSNFRGRGRAPSPSPISKIQLKAFVPLYPRSRERAVRIGSNFACGSLLMI